MPQGLGPSHHNSSSLLSNNFAMTGHDPGERAPGAAWADMVGQAGLDLGVAQIVHLYSMLFMAHLKAGLWAQENVSNKSFD